MLHILSMEVYTLTDFLKRILIPCLIFIIGFTFNGVDIIRSCEVFRFLL